MKCAGGFFGQSYKSSLTAVQGLNDFQEKIAEKVDFFTVTYNKSKSEKMLRTSERSKIEGKK